MRGFCGGNSGASRAHCSSVNSRRSRAMPGGYLLLRFLCKHVLGALDYHGEALAAADAEGGEAAVSVAPL
jgi:hypothetical protein